MADLTSVYADRASFGPVAATSATSPLRVAGLSAFVAGQPRLALDANGNVTSGAIVAAEIPSVFTRRDVAETIAASWTWAAGQTITFAAGTLAPPAASARSIGTRLVVEPVVSSTEYAIGRETAGLWASVPSSAEHRWYTGNVCRLRILTDGTVRAEGGSGYVYGVNTSDGSGGFATLGNLTLVAGASGAIYLQSGTAGSSGLIAPVAPYREALGAIDRKYLSLHAAELWVETLVAQQTLATIGGRILVGPTTTLTRDAAPGDTTIYVKHNSLKLHVPGVEYGSKLLLEAAGKLEVLAVTNSATPAATAQGDYPYAVLRAFGGSAWQWYAGDALFDTGKLASPPGAFIDLYSVQGFNAGSSSGPTIVGNVRTGANAFDWLEHWAIGNLRGLFNNGATDLIGAAFGRPDGMHIQIDSTNGIRMLTGGNTAAYGEWRLDGTVRFGYTTQGSLSFTPSDGALRVQWNGADMMLLTAGTMYLNTGLVAGNAAGTTGIVRSNGATAWNAGTGFYFDAVQATGAARALIGNSAGRRLQWDGASLKVISDGLTIDENGITLQQQTSGAYSPTRAIQWGTGAYLWDSTTNNAFEILRGTGNVQATALGGSIILQGGGSGVDRSTLTISPTIGRWGGVLSGGTKPPFCPNEHNVFDLGRSDLYWGNLYAGVVRTTAVIAASWIGVGNPSTQGSYQIALSADSAAKPTSSTWTVAPSSRAAKTAIEPVDQDDALARVRRVELVRYRVIDGDLPAIGVIAEDVRETLPLSVDDRGDGLLAWNAHELLMLNVAAVQALAARLDALTPKGSTA